MNLIFESVREAEADIPVRLNGRIKYYSYELCLESEETDNSDGDFDFVFKIESSNDYYICYDEHNSCSLNKIINQKNKLSLDNPLEINVLYSYSKQGPVEYYKTPIIKFEPIDVNESLQSVILNIDILFYVNGNRKTNELGEIFKRKIIEHINFYKRAYMFMKKDVDLSALKELISLHYEIDETIMTIALPKFMLSMEKLWIEDISNELNIDFRILQRSMALFPPAEIVKKLTGGETKLVNPHCRLRAQFNDKHVIGGRYTYYHYLQDGIRDKGWGCAYRSLQTIISWYIWQGYTSIDVPTHSEIQKILIDIGDKPPKFADSTEWIGSFELNLVLQELFNIDNTIISLIKGKELTGLYETLADHFDQNRPPVMIGGGELAHTILGVASEIGQHKERVIKFLVLDPHYTGDSNSLNSIIGSGKQGWCDWKEPGKFWKSELSYNLCLPGLPEDERE